ncbi:hypothetical protein DES32_0589 [Methylovirgula ligni]|uniref:Uncharacterized protein n=1 Tax=Methylovirgula ligni TaxID=569860 RepID=A0A3D9Z506_9HYPH|nr:hypothetical protein [Methylovirgula ligni]REF89368.1 hypothetical protein DES32_0589 [Methylovirgula ligni]
MQPIRQPSFSDILEDLALDPHAADDLGEAAPAASSPDWLFRVFVAAAEDIAGDPQDPRTAYHETGEEEPPLLLSLNDEERIIAELELESARTLDDLARIRRAFARRNHPDLMLHPRLAEQATARMKIANMLIDRRRKELTRR